MNEYHIYCDESCHILHDHHKVMVLGAVWCPAACAADIARQIRALKIQHGMAASFEIKWTKVSPAALSFYMAVLDYFFNNDNLHFRALVVPDKSRLRHEDFHQTHDDWYYKMYFDMLKIILSPDARYRIFLDIKDTWGGKKVAKLHQVLCNSIYDFSHDIVRDMQIIRSEDTELLQLADLLIGVVAYANRKLATSAAKLALVNEMRRRSGYELTRSTLFREDKVNIFIWDAS